MRCVACGYEIGVDDERCRKCTAPTVGSSFHDAVEVRVDRPLPLPRICCCCLTPAYEMVEESEESVGLRRATRMTFDLPWCGGCLVLRQSLRRATLFVAIGAALIAFVSTYSLPGAMWVYVTLPTLVVSLVVAQFVLLRYVAQFRLPGHVPGCDAVTASPSGGGGTIYFANRAFARIVRAMQRGEGDPLVLEILGNDPARMKQPPPMTRTPDVSRDADKERRLGAEAMREGARQPIARGRGGIGFATARTGADAAADALRFVAKSCEVDANGIRAHASNGSVRALAWADVASVVVRQLPPGAPFDRALFLDLVPAAGGAPIRLLGTTRGNYAALPGTGVTSQENFRRVVMRVGATRDPATEAFAQKGMAPAKFESIDAFLAYDATYDA